MTPSIQDRLNWARDELAQARVDTPDLEARWIMAHVLRVPRDRIILMLNDDIEDHQIAIFTDHIHNRLSGKPVSHIVGGRFFYGRWFHVTPSVLDPRPDTETLIELALRHPFEMMLDLGTGSGCILCTLLAERPTATGVGVDISQSALDIAELNARDLGVADRSALWVSDWFSAIDGLFDLIVANPPYISQAAYKTLAPSVRLHEPASALTDHGDGLAAYRHLVHAAPKYLTQGGCFMCEIGFDQGPAVCDLFIKAGFDNVHLEQDMNGKNRVVWGYWPH
jgi:release factor glutamine methyltransferase